MRLKSFITDVIMGKIKIHSSDYIGSVTGIRIVG
jgi:hypothetical protein